jgi:hypothetical protein
MHYQVTRCFGTTKSEGEALYSPHITLSYQDDAQQAHNYQELRLILSNLTRIAFRYQYRLVHRIGTIVQH